MGQVSGNVAKCGTYWNALAVTPILSYLYCKFPRGYARQPGATLFLVVVVAVELLSAAVVGFQKDLKNGDTGPSQLQS